MKNLFSAGLIVVLLLGGLMVSSCVRNDEPETELSSESEILTVTLTIDGMSCEGCVKNIESAISQTQGVTSNVVSLASNEAVVKYDAARTNQDQIIAAIQGAGYSASAVN